MSPSLAHAEEPDELAVRRPRRPSLRTDACTHRRAAMSSSCVPCSTMRPWSRTTIRSARRIVDSRWAMTNAVRPARRRPSPRSIRRSVPMSTDDVASSRMRMRGIGEERSRESDELSLAEREPEAALAELGVVALRKLGDEGVGTDRLRPPPRPRPGLPTGRPKAMLSATVPAKRNPSWGTIPSCRAQRRLRDVAQVVAVDRDPSGARIVEASEELRDRRLARRRCGRRGRPSFRAERRDRSRGGRPARLAVPEPDVLEAHVAVDSGQRRGHRRRRRPRAPRRGRCDPVERCGRGEERVVELRELLHGVEEVREVEREREQRAVGEAPVDDERAAEAENDRGRHRGEDVHRREVEAVEHDRLVVRRPVPLVDTAERSPGSSARA